MSAGDTWNAYLAAQQAAHEAVTQCGGSPGDGTPEGDRTAFLLDSAVRGRGAGGAGGAVMTSKKSATPDQARRRRERDRVNHARARAAGRDPDEIPGLEPPLRRVVLPVSRAPQTGWQHRAACRTSPPEWFDAESDEDAVRALAVCAGCEVREECFLAAAADRAESGVWGGVDLSAADRVPGKAVAS